MEEGTVKKPIWKKWWFWGIIIILLIALGSSGSDNKDQGTGTKDGGATPAVADKAKTPDLEIIEHSTENDSFSTYIVGTVKNNTGKEYTYVQVEINLYDANGAQVGSTLANANNLEPNGSWKFKAVTLEEFSTYKIKDVTGY